MTVLAASSLTDAFGELESLFEEQNEGVDVTISFADNSELLVQIQQGAPADVYAPADKNRMNIALEEGLVTEPEIYISKLGGEISFSLDTSGGDCSNRPARLLLER